MLRPLVTPSIRPNGPCEIPEIHRRAIRYEEHLAIHLFVVQWHSLRAARCEQSVGGEQVRVRHVADIGEVEEVRVLTELEARLVGVVDVQDGRENLHIAFAKDAGGADGGCEELGVRGRAVGG